MKHERTQSGMSKLLGWTAICMTVFGIATQATAATNPVPYIDDFESYTDGQVLAVDQGWYAAEADALTIVTTNDTYSGVRYLTGPTTKVLEFSADATNMVDDAGATTDGIAYVDVLVKPTQWTEETHPVVPGAQFAYYVSTNEQLVLNCRIFDGTYSNTWLTITNVTVPSNEWVRVTTKAYYDKSEIDSYGFDNFYQIWVNETLVRHEFADPDPANGEYYEGVPLDPQGSYFLFANNASKISAVGVSGTGLLDDLVVTTNDTLNTGVTNYTVTASAGADGSITPEGAFTVAAGTDSGPYAIEADSGFKIETVLVNGGSIALTNDYAIEVSFTNIQSNQTVAASFATDEVTTWTITTLATTNGSISPAGAIIVADGASTNFTITANLDYDIANVTIDGGSIGATNAVAFDNVTTNYTLGASFTPTATAGGAPHWWLRDYGLTNDFGAADTNDADGDGLTDTEEYVASTDPTNDTSRLQVSEIVNVGGTNKFIWYSVGIDATLPPYGIEGNTNLNNTNDWQPVETLTEDRSATNEWDVPAGTKFYRIVATNNVTP